MRWNACELVWRAAGEGHRVSRDAERPPFGPPSQPQLLHGLLDRHPPGAMRAADPWRPAGSGGAWPRLRAARGLVVLYRAHGRAGPLGAHSCPCEAPAGGRPADTILPLENEKSEELRSSEPGRSGLSTLCGSIIRSHAHDDALRTYVLNVRRYDGCVHIETSLKNVLCMVPVLT